MVSFSVKKIKTGGAIGDLLKKKRQEYGWDIKEISRRIGVAERYLEYLENEEWDRLPGEVYVRNFLRRYSMAVGLLPDRIEKIFKGQQASLQQQSIGSLQRTLPLPGFHFLNLPRFLKNTGILLAVFSLVFYLGWQAMQYFRPPDLIIYSPQDNLITPDSSIVLKGETDPEVEVRVNDIPIAVNNGKFQEEFDLLSGVNVLKITAIKKQGASNELYRKVLWRPESLTKN